MAINRPTTKTIISTTQWGVPITDAVNANVTDVSALKTATAVTPLTQVTYKNGFASDVFTGGVQYQRWGKWCWLGGGMSTGTQQTSAFTMPNGFIPARGMRMPMSGYSAGGTPTLVRGDFYDTNGDLVVWYQAGTIVVGLNIVYPVAGA
jgi:hypothetical protein